MKDIHFDVAHGVHDVVKQFNWEETASAVKYMYEDVNLISKIYVTIIKFDHSLDTS